MTHDVAVLPGDGIGPAVTDAALRVVEAAGVDLETHEHTVGVPAYEETRESVPEPVLEACREADAILLGATTTPPGVEGYRSAAVTLRQELDLYANLRPARSVPGIGHPGLDVTVVRENTEGLYSGVERREKDRVVAERIVTRAGCERVVRFAFEHARATGRDRVTAVHKANILRETDGLFLEAARDVADDYAGVELEDRLVDAAAYMMVLEPEDTGLLVTTNLFGDVLSDEAAGLLGSLGLAPSANLGDAAAMFEPVHGSAPDIAGQGVANPAGAIRSAALMLDRLGEPEAARAIQEAVDAALADAAARTPDVGGEGTTAAFTDRVVQEVAP